MRGGVLCRRLTQRHKTGSLASGAALCYVAAEITPSPLAPSRWQTAARVWRLFVGALHIFTGKDFVDAIRHAEAPDLGLVRRRLENSPALLHCRPEAIPHAILDEVVDGYAPVVAGLENDIDEIEGQLFQGDPVVPRRIYELSLEVIEFQRATKPLLDTLTSLEGGFEKYAVDVELQRNLRDVHDHAIRITERVDASGPCRRTRSPCIPPWSGSSRTRRCVRSPSRAWRRTRKSRGSRLELRFCSPRCW